MSDEYGSVEWAGKFSGLRETVPDTQDDILWDKIGKSIGVYSGVYEYAANGEFAELQAGSLQCNYGFAALFVEITPALPGLVLNGAG